MVKHLGDEEVMEIQIIENLQRKNLNALEEAEGFERLLKFGGYTAELLAMKLNKSRGYVYGRLKLLALGPAGRGSRGTEYGCAGGRGDGRRGCYRGR